MAHNFSVNSLCTLKGNRLLSGSSDCSIKVWTLSRFNLTLIKEIQEYTKPIWKVIPLSKGRFAFPEIGRLKYVKMMKHTIAYLH